MKRELTTKRQLSDRTTLTLNEGWEEYAHGDIPWYGIMPKKDYLIRRQFSEGKTLTAEDLNHNFDSVLGVGRWYL